MREITAAADVTEDVLEALFDVIEGWYADEPIDWEDVLNRLEKGTDWDFTHEMDTPAIKKLQREGRAFKREIA